MDTFDAVAPAALLHMDPVEPVPYDSTQAMLGEFTERAIEAALEVAGPGAGSPVSFEVRHVGGALSRSDGAHGALDTLRGEYMMFGIAPVMEPGMATPMPADLERLDDAFPPDDTGRYLNITEVEHDLEEMFPAGAVERLREVKVAYDPGGPVQSKPRGLGVRTNHVVQLGKASTGRPLAEGSVRSAPVIELEPAR